METQRMSNIRAMLRRQTAPGSLVLLLLALYLVTPRFVDYLRGDPWINSSMGIFINSNGEYMIEESVYTPSASVGVRANVIETEDGSILCAGDHHNTWRGERKRNWTLPAFAACNMTPIVGFRVCSKFNVESVSGRRAEFGPFCSSFIYPAAKRTIPNG